jgi:hypothetical protein
LITATRVIGRPAAKGTEGPDWTLMFGRLFNLA